MMRVEEVYLSRCLQVCNDLGIQFDGFLEEQKDIGKTKCNLYCSVSGLHWETTGVSALVRRKDCPCRGCSKKRKMVKKVPVSSVEESHWERVSNLAHKLGLLFIGFTHTCKDKDKTKIKLYCKKHQVYSETTNISNFLYRKTSPCPRCVADKRSRTLLTSEPDLKNLVGVCCQEGNTTFLGWAEEYKGVLTKVRQRCNIHVDVTWDTTEARRVTSKEHKNGCPSCKKVAFRKSILSNTEKHVQAFIGTGKFQEGTLFHRNEVRKTTKGALNYWDVYCPVCDETHTSFVGSLKKGAVPCSCGKLANTMGLYPDRLAWSDNLYLLHYEDEDFYKIGRSFEVSTRLKNLKGVYKNIKVISIYKGVHEDVYKLEGMLHRLLHKERITPKLSFGGASECFNSSILLREEVISTFRLSNG